MSQNKDDKKKTKATPKPETQPVTEETAATAETLEEATPDPVQQELAQTKELLLRTAAEYENFKRRSIKEKEDSYAFAVISTVSALLPCIDNFELAAAAPCTDEEYKKGCMLILQQFTDTLNKLNVTEMDCLGQPFNPDEHNAVMHVDDEAFGESTVAEVLQKGYKLGDKVVRHAMVKVAN